MLTPKQENFCLSYLETGNASEAYRRAYNIGRRKPATVNRNAKSLVDNNKILARLSELRAPVIAKALCTYEQHLDRLEELCRKAEEAGNFAAAISAEISRGKAAGHYLKT